MPVESFVIFVGLFHLFTVGAFVWSYHNAIHYKNTRNVREIYDSIFMGFFFFFIAVGVDYFGLGSVLLSIYIWLFMICYSIVVAFVIGVVQYVISIKKNTVKTKCIEKEVA